MNKGLIIGVLALAVLGVGGYMLFSTQQVSKPSQTPEPIKTTSPTTEANTEEKAVDTVMEKAAVEIKNFSFSPNKLTVKPGQVISVTNKDVASHTMTSDDGKSFESGLIGKDQVKTVAAPTKPGSYPFHCTPHPNMKATLVVEE